EPTGKARDLRATTAVTGRFRLEGAQLARSIARAENLRRRRGGRLRGTEIRGYADLRRDTRRRAAEYVPDGRDRFDSSRCAAVALELAPQVADVRAKRVRVAARAAPHVRVHAARWDHAAGVRREEIQDPELCRRDAHECVAPGD